MSAGKGEGDHLVPCSNWKKPQCKCPQRVLLHAFLPESVSTLVLLSLGPSVVFHCKVQAHIADLVREHFPSDVEVVMRDPVLFGDFRMALQEGEARIYEDIQDYEAAKALFQVWTGLTSPGNPAGVLRRQSWEGHLCVCLPSWFRM